MSDIGSINPLTGANPALARVATGSRSEPPTPPTVQDAVAQPLTTAQSAVTQSPAAGNAEWQRETNADGRQQNQAGAAASGRQQLAETIDDLNRKLRSYDTNLQFEVDDKYQEMVVRIIDRETKEVIRQIPSEKALALAKFFKDLEAEQEQDTSVAKRANSKDSGGLKIEGWLLRATV